MKHPVFQQEFDFKTQHKLDLTEDRIFELKKIFAIANRNETGVIGRKQFVDLMKLLRISPTDVSAPSPAAPARVSACTPPRGQTLRARRAPRARGHTHTHRHRQLCDASRPERSLFGLPQDELDRMMVEMDKNGDGEIEFEEFAVAMVHTYDDDMISSAAMVRSEHAQVACPSGLTPWRRRFPSAARARACGIAERSSGPSTTKSSSSVRSERRLPRQDGTVRPPAEPHLCGAVCSVGITVLVYFDFILIPLTLAYFIVFLLNPILKLLEKRPYSGKCTPKEHEKRKDTPDSAAVALYDCYTVGKLPHMAAVLVTLGGFFLLLFLLVRMVANELGAFLDDPLIQTKLKDLQIDLDTMLNESGIVILEPPICEFEADCPLGPNNCYGPKMLPCAHDGYTMEQLTNYLSTFNTFFGQFAAVMLFVIYIMIEVDVDKSLLSGDSPAVSEIEGMISHYINLKTMLSLITGALVATILWLLNVKLAVLFGIMSFVLNYIPNVGSLIAIFLPAPVVMLDPGLLGYERVLAFVGPGIVQMFVGNVLEPSVFGKSLNMTAMSILGALVIWTGIWGIPGAVLSVPLLGIQKILMVYTNHPFAKYMLLLIRA